MQNGAGIEFSEEKAKTVLSEKEIEILISLNDGNGDATAWGCDLTYDYVKINGVTAPERRQKKWSFQMRTGQRC